MTIDPRIGFWLSIALAVIGVFATSATQLTTIFGQHATDIVLATASLLMAVGNAINAILHAIPSKDTPQALKSFYLGPKQPPQG